MEHFFLFRHDLGPSGHAPKMVAHVPVITLTGHRVRVADDMAFRGSHFRKGIPVVRREHASPFTWLTFS